MDKDHNKYINNLEIYEFNMDKYVDMWYTNDKEKIDKFKYLIMMDLPKEELERLSKEDEVVERYMKKSNILNEDPRFQVFLSREEDDKRRRNSEINEAKEEKAEEIAENLKNRGMSKEEIYEITGVKM